MLDLIIYPRNLGINADSCKIRFQILKNNVNYKNKDTIIYGFGFIDTLDYKFSIDSTGSYDIKIILDPDNWNNKESKTDNIITIPLIIKNYSYFPLKPVNNQIDFGDSIEFVGINPNFILRNNAIKLILQIDTTSNFNSSFLQTFFVNNLSGIIQKFKKPIPVVDSNIVYFWRLNTVSNNDTIGWTEPRKFTIRGNLSSNDSLVRIKKSKLNAI